jgi:thiol-disulfide isomerase/thioredoxin
MRRLLVIKKCYCIIWLSCLLFTSSIALAQGGKIPPFRMLQSNNRIFKAEDLPMGKPIILIYFSPECDHCDKLMKELFGKAAQFKKASIAMITYLPIEKVSKFEREFSLNQYLNIYVGTEGTSFFVRDYYRLTEMPFVALYTSSGDFVKSYTKDVALKDLSDRLNKLK